MTKSRLDELLASGKYLDYKQPGRPLFTFQSNVYYNGHIDTDVPGHAFSVVIKPHDCVQVVEVIDSNWWLGSVVGQGARCGYIPSMSKWLAKYREEHGIGRSKRPSIAIGELDDSTDSSDTLIQDKTQRLDYIFRRTGPDEDIPAHRLTHAPKGVVFAGKGAVRPYRLAPDVRPLILMGPTRKGSSITQHLHKALVGYLCLSFPDHVHMVHVPPTPVRAKRNSRSTQEDDDIFDEVIITEVYNHARQGKMCIVTCDVDDPVVLRQSAIVPILVLLRIPNPTILNKLARASEDRDDSKNVSTLVQVLTKLNAHSSKTWNLVLPRSKLEISCYELAAYWDAYYHEATMPLEIPTELDTEYISLDTPGTVTETIMFDKF
eukprot:TRINITY_DN8330_c0_g1_i1.p1 TRINITY_DN8330_c0_g1~~TRINITY_DN8330_c0_g1_i1.p1  ORF type:complete len:376 (+),score=47.96 TRINITY_DN8330_c0_g1_i1:135-1262(+)